MQAERATKTVDIESHPWSNSSPRGLAVPVLLACLPSMASKLWYMNKPKPHKAHAHLGASIFASGEYLGDKKNVKNSSALQFYKDYALPSL